MQATLLLCPWRMVPDPVFACRGLLAFVAFTEFATACRCLLPGWALPNHDQDFVREKLFPGAALRGESERLAAHLYGLVCLLTSLALLHLAVFVHHKPLASLASLVTFSKLVLVLGHAFGYGTVPRDQNLVFPVLSTAFALAAATAVPFLVDAKCARSGLKYQREENEDQLRQIRAAKKTKRQ